MSEKSKRRRHPAEWPMVSLAGYFNGTSLSYLYGGHIWFCLGFLALGSVCAIIAIVVSERTPR